MARKVFEYQETQDSETPRVRDPGGSVLLQTDRRPVPSLEVLDYLAGLTGGDGVARIQTMMKLFNEFIPEGDIPRFRKTVKTRRCRSAR